MAAADNQWYFMHNGQKFGPVTAANLSGRQSVRVSPSGVASEIPAKRPETVFQAARRRKGSIKR